MLGEITAIRVRAGKPDRVEVMLDGTRTLRLAKNLALPLRVGQSLTQVDIEALLRKDQEERTYRNAVRLISRRPRSEQELRQRYRRKDVPEAAVDAVVERLSDAGLLDDHAFAQAWVENRLTFRPRGIMALRHELRKKGVKDQVIETVLQDVDETQAIERAAEKAVRRYKHLSEDVFHRRLFAYLARRGFRYSMVSPIVDRMWYQVVNERDESEDET